MLDKKEIKVLRAERWQKYYKDNLEHLTEYYRMKWRTVRGKFFVLKGCARKRGIEVNLTLEQFTKLISKPCYYCGGALPVAGSGVDRVSRSKGYVIGNVRACCKYCNQAKNSMTVKQFISWARKMLKHWDSIHK